MLLNVGNQPVRTMDSVHLDGKITQKPKKMIIAENLYLSECVVVPDFEN